MENEININAKHNIVIQFWRIFIVLGIKPRTPNTGKKHNGGNNNE